MSSRALVHALQRAGLAPAGPLGAGAGGPRWSARDAAGRAWAVTVVPADAVARADLRRRVAALAALDHPHVARVRPLLELRDGTAAVLQAEVVGPDLGTVRAARGPLRPGEVTTVVVPLAEALAALHRVGVVHGDVAPANVVLDPDGRPVLVDLACGAAGVEAGTPGFAAPERASGATPAGDVHALARVGLALLGADGVVPASEGAGDGGADAGSALAAVLRAAASPDPGLRPTAADLAAQVYAACPPEPVRLPDAAVLARLTLRRLAVPPDDATARLRTERRPRRRAAGGPAGAPGRGAGARGRHRARRRGPRGVAAVLLVGLGLAAVVGASLQAGDLRAAASPDASPPRAVGAADPVAAAVRLTTARTRALVDRDRDALAAVTLPGSPAAAADALVARDVWRRTPTAGGAEVVEARLLGVEHGVEHGDGPTTARVLVRARAWVRTGEPAADPPPGGEDASAPDAVVLVLVRDAGTWRVSAVEPPPGPAPAG